MPDYAQKKSLIEEVFATNDDMSSTLNERFSELRNIFIVQLSALSKIKEGGFFTTLTDKFWNALGMFLELAKFWKKHIDQKKDIDQKNADRLYLIRDSYSFIKSFDNALQGYLNSDRQFLEFPGHSISLYDLPAKLGVVYTHLIDNIIGLFRDDNDKTAYLLCPEPSNEEGIHVRRLLSRGPCTDYFLIIIEAPATSMFKPREFLFALCHEIAHYVGRSHRVFEFDDQNNRNKMLYTLHRNEQVEVFLGSLAEMLENLQSSDSSYDSVICKSIYVNLYPCMESILEERDPLMNQIQLKSTYTEVKDLLKEAYANPLLRTLDKQIRTAIGRCNLSFLGEKQLNTFKKYKLPNLVEKTLSRVNYIHEYLFYLVKECTADTLAIKLLAMEFNDYISRIYTEEAKIIDNNNLKTAIKMREYIVCKACFDIDISKEGDSYKMLTEKSITQLEQYLKAVYQRFGVDKNNTVRQLYAQAKDNDNLPFMLSKYML